MKVDIRKLDGSKTDGQIDLKKTVFGIEPRAHVVYLAVKAEMANRRQGSADTLRRGEVAGSGIKLYRQKGTGRARVGDGQSPIRYGGGVAFGPHPRSYRQKVNKKVRQLARKSLLSSLQKDERIVIVDALDIPEAKTRIMAQTVKALGLDGRKVVVLSEKPTPELWLASRNLPGIQIRVAKDVSAYDLWSTDYVLADKSGIQALQAALS